MQWEVGPGTESPGPGLPTSDADDEVDASGGGSDNPDPRTETECFSDYNQDSGETSPEYCYGPDARWRIDVLVDDESVGAPAALEIKAWSAGAPNAARDQLDRYVDLARERGLPVTRSSELNGPAFWSTSYLDSELQTMCVWADPDPAYNGVVYFALKNLTPPLVRERTPGCRDSDNREKVFEELDKAIAEFFIADYLLNKLAELEPRLSNRDQQVDESQLFVPREWVVDAPKAPDRARVVNMAFGDGASATVTVPAGSGTQRVAFSHAFSSWNAYGTTTYNQRVTIESNGAPASGSVTLSRADEPVPAHVCD